jgi:pyruvate,water dikinase
LQSRPIIPLQNRPIVDYKLALPGIAQPTNTLSTEGKRLLGVPICPGEVMGKVVILREVPDPRSISPEAILVVPYLKATEIPALAKVLGLIAETGGQLSNGAIAAREYGIPTIVLPAEGGDRLATGHRVRLNGALGFLELM